MNANRLPGIRAWWAHLWKRILYKPPHSEICDCTDCYIDGRGVYKPNQRFKVYRS